MAPFIPRPLVVTLCIVCGCVGFVLPRTSEAQIQLMDSERLANHRDALPLTDAGKWNALFADPNTLIYTARDIPPAYQFHHDGPIESVGGTTSFHSPRYNISGDAREAAKGHGRGGNGNIEFPWRMPGGVDGAEGSVQTFKLLRLPDRDGGVWPVVTYRDTVRGARVGPDLALHWMFPAGTIFGEVLTLKDSRGALHVFEVRLRIRERDFWDIEILRPFPTAESFAVALAERGYQATQQPQVTLRQLLDRGHPSQVAFNVKAGVESLPALSEELAAELLDNTPFKSTVGGAWRKTETATAFAPTTDQEFSIVPKKYTGTFLGTDTDSCKKCHEHTLKHVDVFDTQRDWYGYVRGSDQIFTFHPVEPSSIAYNGGTIPVRLRESFVRAGMVEKFDPARHPSSVYHPLK